jgi:hypothetical protein
MVKIREFDRIEVNFELGPDKNYLKVHINS